MRGIAPHALATALALSLSAAGAPAEERPLPPPGDAAWETLRFRSIESATRYERVEVDGLAGVRARSACSASGLVLRLEAVDLRRTPHLAWLWRVERGVDVPDERVREGDDFAARVYAMFRFEPERVGRWRRALQRIGEILYGAEPPGTAVSYVWSARPVGETWVNPFSDDTRMVSLGSGPLSRWRREERDLAADYRRAFGREPPELIGVALMTDSDNSCQTAEALFADFRLLGPREERAPAMP